MKNDRMGEVFYEAQNKEIAMTLNMCTCWNDYKDIME